MNIHAIVKSKVQVALVAVAVVASVLLLGQIVSASLAGPDRTSDFKPLVRHSISQAHCYDNGTDMCENAGYSKEFTIGYLATSAVGSSTVPLYGCHNRAGNLFFAATSPKECKNVGATKAFVLGHLFTDNNLETPFSLYRCLNSEGKDALLTDDPSECSLVNYNNVQLLGYLPAGGTIPQQRLNDMCATVDKYCTGSETGALKDICEVHTGLCKGPK